MKDVEKFFKEWGSICRLLTKEDKAIYSYRELLDFAEAYHQSKVNNGVLDDVSGSKFIEFNYETTVGNGIYKVKTNKGRIICCEFTFNRWFELAEPIEEGEKVIGYYR